MRALIISGGGSKGAFAGGVAQYLMEVQGYKYDMFIGTSTGSLLISHLALNKTPKIKDVYTSVDQNSINHFNVLKNLIKGRKTFGESQNLKNLILDSFSPEEFEELKAGNNDIVVTVSNLSLNEVEYKSINEYNYEDFCEWIWISCNYIPFMSLVKKNGCEYADGGFGSMAPIEEAIKRGATEIDAIILQTEVTYFNRLPSKNVFSLITNLFSFMLDRIENQNVRIGKFVAANHDALINFYYTPTVLTTNSLIFDKIKMESWWESGYSYAKFKNEKLNQIEI